MKNQFVSSSEIDTKIRKTILKTQKAIRTKDLQKCCLDRVLSDGEKTETNSPIGLKFPIKRKFRLLIAYLIILHYYPLDRSLYCYFFIDLQELLEECWAYWLSVLLNKDFFLKYLEVQEVLTMQGFCSSICNEAYLVETINQIRFRFEEKLVRPRRIIRRKGYRDKGTLGPHDLRVLKRELSEDFYLTLYQFELEQKRIIRQEQTTLLRDYLAEGKEISDELKVEFRLIPRKEVLTNERSERSFTAEDYCKQRADYTDRGKDPET